MSSGATPDDGYTLVKSRKSRRAETRRRSKKPLSKSAAKSSAAPVSQQPVTTPPNAPATTTAAVTSSSGTAGAVPLASPSVGVFRNVASGRGIVPRPVPPQAQQHSDTAAATRRGETRGSPSPSPPPRDSRGPPETRERRTPEPKVRQWREGEREVCIVAPATKSRL